MPEPYTPPTYKFRIRHGSGGAALYEGVHANYKAAVVAAVAAHRSLAGAFIDDGGIKISLADADLAGANFAGAFFSYVHFSGANLTGANFSGARFGTARLTSANLTRANLSKAVLGSVNLANACLRDADLSGAGITGADLTGADLRGAKLTGVDLASANWTVVRDDLFAMLASAKSETPGLLDALRTGKADRSGIVPTLIALRGHAWGGLEHNANRPAEVLWLAIGAKGTPENDPIARLFEVWIEEWLPSPAATAVVHRDLCPHCGQDMPAKAA